MEVITVDLVAVEVAVMVEVGPVMVFVVVLVTGGSFEVSISLAEPDVGTFSTLS